jgi:hypothetical protein
MSNTATIVNNLTAAITWSKQKYFDPSFHGVNLAEASSEGLKSAVSQYNNFFPQVTELDTSNLPDESVILSLFNQNVSLLTEEAFIIGQDGVVRTNNKIITSKQQNTFLQDKSDKSSS